MCQGVTVGGELAGELLLSPQFGRGFPLLIQTHRMHVGDLDEEESVGDLQRSGDLSRRHGEGSLGQGLMRGHGLPPSVVAHVGLAGEDPRILRMPERDLFEVRAGGELFLQARDAGQITDHDEGEADAPAVRAGGEERLQLCLLRIAANDALAPVELTQRQSARLSLHEAAVFGAAVQPEAPAFGEDELLVHNGLNHMLRIETFPGALRHSLKVGVVVAYGHVFVTDPGENVVAAERRGLGIGATADREGRGQQERFFDHSNPIFAGRVCFHSNITGHYCPKQGLKMEVEALPEVLHVAERKPGNATHPYNRRAASESVQSIAAAGAAR